jgi:hypothetical protein
MSKKKYNIENRTVVCDANNILDAGIVLKTDKEKYAELEREYENDLNNDKKCAPGKTYSDGSCLTTKNLVAIIKAYNRHMKVMGKKDLNIQLKWSGGGNEKKKYKKYLLLELDKALDSVCKDQQCWLKQKFVKYLNDDDKQDIYENTFRPTGPQGRFTWLNTINIEEVMNQYSKLYPEFKFMGAVPIDFDDLEKPYKLSRYNYGNFVKEGVHKIGAVFNLDPHYERGSHWVALYADLKSGEINFFDSYGTKPTKEIVRYMNSLANNVEKIGGSPKLRSNNIRHQYKNSECGVYSINFITRSLAGNTFKEITESRVPDDAINMCRDVYFNSR